MALIALLAERTLRVIDLVVGWRGSLFVVFEMLGYLIPHYMGLALPVAFFLGILLTFSRLSREGELAAIYASGAGLPQLLRPILVAALVLAVIVALLVSVLQPYARYAYRAATYALTNASFTTLLQERPVHHAGRHDLHGRAHLRRQIADAARSSSIRAAPARTRLTITVGDGPGRAGRPDRADRAQAAGRSAAAGAGRERHPGG